MRPLFMCLACSGLLMLQSEAADAPAAPFKVAAVEFNPQLFAFRENIPPLCAIIEEAAKAGAKIIVTPETAVSGYIYRDRRQFDPFLDSVPGETTAAIAKLTKQYGCYVTVGIAEIDPATGLAFNTAALVGPEGYIGKYRKVGLNTDDQLWFTIGNLGYPVFETKYGKLAMEICYDDTYWEVARTAAVKGAQILCFMSSSDRALPGKPGSAGNHSTISAVQEINSWNGVALIATDRNNSETNPTTGLTVYYGGIAAIWSPTGKKLAQAPGTNPEVSAAAPPRIIYATIDPGEFENPIKASFAERRPEIYTALTFYRSPTDPKASQTRHAVNAQVVQFAPAAGDREANFVKVSRLLGQPAWKSGAGRLIVLPEYSFTGPPANAAQAAQFAELPDGPGVQMAATLANQMNAHVVFSLIEKDGTTLYPATMLVGPDGKILGTYRKTHLDAGEGDWAAAGDAFPVFDTAIGRIGMLQGGDVRFPEASGILCVHRADIIAIPSSWRGQYGGFLDVSPALFAERYPENTMKLWYAIAKTAQAYTVVANTVGGDFRGSSGLFTLNPVDAKDPAIVAGPDAEQALSVSFTTLADPSWWMSQQNLIAGRRVDLCAPLTFPTHSEAFKKWQSAPGFDLSIWADFSQRVP
ncbi:MAG TPA: nitrilase-related carbon-nitrogen hydrolase [Terrimicrobiaceae bacterium]|nr:nitrilase-related carbon-nitrogen hydrolase [Terrimicrobiaceae bacterium]